MSRLSHDHVFLNAFWGGVDDSGRQRFVHFGLRVCFCRASGQAPRWWVWQRADRLSIDHQCSHSYGMFILCAEVGVVVVVAVVVAVVVVLLLW